MADPLEMFRKRMKETREQKGITLKELAEHIGVKEATVQRYEGGSIRSVPYESITAIAEYLGTTPAYLMGWEKPSKQYAIDLADLVGDRELMDHVSILRSMDSGKRKQVYSYIRFLDAE